MGRRCSECGAPIEVFVVVMADPRGRTCIANVPAHDRKSAERIAKAEFPDSWSVADEKETPS